MPPFEIVLIFFTFSVFDSPKGSSNTSKTYKNIGHYFKRMHIVIRGINRQLSVNEMFFLLLLNLKEQQKSGRSPFTVS